MNREGNTWVMMFAVGMCVILAVLLAGTFSALKGKVDANIDFDRQMNVLIATGLYSKAEGGESKTRAELEELYTDRIIGKVLEVKRGMVDKPVKGADGEPTTIKVEKVTDLVETEYTVEDLPRLQLEQRREKDPAKRKEFTTFYTRVDEQGEAVAYCIPIEGLGLWGMIYGFLALEHDLATVKGITFYQHKETPGLGGEIDNPDWQSQWKGKSIYDAGDDFVSVTVKKGKVDKAVAYEKEHMVDGLSGATITSNGVTKFVAEDLQTYMPYFEKLKGE